MHASRFRSTSLLRLGAVTVVAAVLTSSLAVADGPAQASRATATAATAVSDQSAAAVSAVERAERALQLEDDAVPDRVAVLRPGARTMLASASEPVPVTVGASGSRTIAYTADELDEGATRLAAVLGSRDQSSASWSFPAGTELYVLDDGRVSVADADGDLIAGVDAPWAIDAAGQRLPTRFAVNGSELVQHVVFDSGTRFPVVADPKITTFPGYWQVTFNRSESATVVGTVASCAALLSKSPHPALRALTVGCGTFAAFSTAQLAGGKCVRAHLVGIPPVVGTWWPTFPKC